MIERISVILSKEWGEILRVDEEVDCYRYGLELLLSTFCNTIILVIISSVFQRPFLFIPYTFVYVPMRMFAGGYHADSHLKCILFSAISYTLCIILCRYCIFNSTKYFCVCIIAVSAIIIKRLVPVASENKPLTHKQERQARINVYVIELVIIGIWICGYCLGKFNEYLYMLFFAEGAVIITIVLGYLKNKCRL